MGQTPAHTTQAADEGSQAPLVSPSGAWYVWRPMLRKATAVIVGAVGLAGIGALSMAHAPTGSGSASTAPPALAGVLAPTEWLATGTATGDATKPPPQPPCPPEPGAAPAVGTRSETAPVPPMGHGSARLSDGRLVLNLATPSELTTLPGIGLKRAEAIIALRSKLKGFRKLSDLLRIKGIGVKSLRKLEPKLVLDAPAPEG